MLEVHFLQVVDELRTINSLKEKKYGKFRIRESERGKGENITVSVGRRGEEDLYIVKDRK